MKLITILLAGIVFICFKCPAQSTVVDYDGNVYNTAMFGSQKWMLENLIVLHYNNGNPIPIISDSTQWFNTTIGAVSYYNNDSSYIKSYGYLYNGYTILDSRKMCPQNGWRIPTTQDYINLITYLGGTDIAGGKLKESSSIYWESPNCLADMGNVFSALPSGIRTILTGYTDIKVSCAFWTSTEEWGGLHALDLVNFLCEATIGNSFTFDHGFSIRCLKDSIASVNDTLALNNKVNNLQIYPNPTLGVVNIKYIGSELPKMYLYSVIGQIILEKDLKPGNNTIDLSSLSNGSYLIKFVGRSLNMQRILVKE